MFTLVIAALGGLVLLAGALLVGRAVRRRSSRADGATAPAPTGERLPAGADAALWSIVEAVPDPRNHLALTRDLTGEVRITGTPLDPALREPSIAPAPAPPRPVGPARPVAPAAAPAAASTAPAPVGPSAPAFPEPPRRRPAISLASLDEVDQRRYERAS